MHLFIAELMVRHEMSPKYFFRLAHQWRFGRDGRVMQDVHEYNTSGTIPPYVQEYVEHIQKQGEQCLP